MIIAFFYLCRHPTYVCFYTPVSPHKNYAPNKYLSDFLPLHLVLTRVEYEKPGWGLKSKLSGEGPEIKIMGGGIKSGKLEE